MSRKKRTPPTASVAPPPPPVVVALPDWPARKMALALLGLVLAAAAYFRLAHLGLSALRADTILFLTVCQQPLSPGAICTQWMNLVGGGQMPTPLAFTKLFITVLHLPLNHVTIRLPAALWGIATVPVLYAIGVRLGGRRVGLVAAALMAFNTFHILVTREAYYYPPGVLGAALVYLGALWAVQRVRRGERFTIGYVATQVLGTGLVLYGQVTIWSIALFCAVTVMICELLLWRRKQSGLLNLVVLAAGYVLVSLPLLIYPWGLKQILGTTPGSENTLISASMKQFIDWTLLGRMIREVCTSFLFGATPIRAGVSLLAVILAVVVLVARARRDRTYWLGPGLIVAGFLFFLLSRGKTGAGYESRYLVGYLPVLVAGVALGIGGLPALGGARAARALAWGAGGLLAVALLLAVYPDWQATRLTGKTTPYRDITAWFDQHMPRNSLVLVDRWFEPWNELAVYPSTNVTYTFTVPNEPPATFLANRWRDTAKDFFEKFPDAAYLPLNLSYVDDPEIGPWDWPQTYFARQAGITNFAALKLRAMGLGNRSDFYAPSTNRLIVTIYYNTLEDILAKWRAEHKPFLVLFGPDWGYFKPWRQGDFTDFRVMTAAATLDVYNLAPGATQATLVVHGLAINGAKRVQVAGGAPVDYPPFQRHSGTFGPLPLAPGKNTVALQDVMGGRASIPLLVERVEVRP